MLVLMLTTLFNAFSFLVFMLIFLASQLRKTLQAAQRVLSSVKRCNHSMCALGEAVPSIVAFHTVTLT